MVVSSFSKCKAKALNVRIMFKEYSGSRRFLLAKEKKWLKARKIVKRQEVFLSDGKPVKRYISLFMAVINGTVPVFLSQVKLYINARSKFYRASESGRSFFVNGKIVIYNASRLHNTNLTLGRLRIFQPLHESLRNVSNIFTRSSF